MTCHNRLVLCPYNYTRCIFFLRWRNGVDNELVMSSSFPLLPVVRYSGCWPCGEPVNKMLEPVTQEQKWKVMLTTLGMQRSFIFRNTYHCLPPICSRGSECASAGREWVHQQCALAMRVRTMLNMKTETRHVRQTSNTGRHANMKAIHLTAFISADERGKSIL